MTNQPNTDWEITVATTQRIPDVKVILRNWRVYIYGFKYLIKENPKKEKSENKTEAKHGAFSKRSKTHLICSLHL